MNKKLIIGSVLIALGVIFGIYWRLQGERRANYDSPDPGFYLILLGILVFCLGLNKPIKKKSWVGIGVLFVFLGLVGCVGLGQAIGRLYYGYGISWPVFVYLLLGAIGLWILLRGEK